MEKEKVGKKKKVCLAGIYVDVFSGEMCKKVSDNGFTCTMKKNHMGLHFAGGYIFSDTEIIGVRFL
jgi:hypothetical protein